MMTKTLKVMPTIMPTVSFHHCLAFFVIANPFCSHSAAIFWYISFPPFVLSLLHDVGFIGLFQ